MIPWLNYINERIFTVVLSYMYGINYGCKYGKFQEENQLLGGEFLNPTFRRGVSKSNFSFVFFDATIFLYYYYYFKKHPSLGNIF